MSSSLVEPCLLTRKPQLSREARQVCERLHAGESAVLVRLTEALGSTPREAGAWMAVFGAGDAVGSIGGGQLEWQAGSRAADLLASHDLHPGQTVTQEWGLGPSLGQCCGGRVRVAFERINPQSESECRLRLAHTALPVPIFGAGHVGLAIARATTDLPLAVTLIDSRPLDEWQVNDPCFPSVEASVERVDPPQDAVSDISSGAAALVMTHSHAQDFDILLALLERQMARADLPFIGLIGSQSKWAGFRRRLVDRGVSSAVLEQVHCPIGLPGIVGKTPATIAASVVAQLLTLMPAPQ